MLKQTPVNTEGPACTSTKVQMIQEDLKGQTAEWNVFSFYLSELFSTLMK